MKIDTQCIKTAQSQSVAEWGGIKKKKGDKTFGCCVQTFKFSLPKKKANERQEEVVESVVKIKGFV